MARVIEFYIPTNFKPKSRQSLSEENGQLLEFPGPEPDGHHHPEPDGYQHATWIFPEVDGDLSAREG
jgi:hypothetical protein